MLHDQPLADIPLSAEGSPPAPKPYPLCPICGAAGRELAASWDEWVSSLTGREDGELRRTAAERCGVAQEAPDLVRCRSCHSVSLHPIPTRAQLEQLYAGYHMTSGFLAKAEKKVARARRRLLLLSLLMPKRHDGPRRMLELGASIGTAAEAGRRRGLDAFALELDAAAVTEGRRLFPEVKFTRGRIEDMPGEARFEILYAAEVIEHLRDPAAFLRHCRRLLVPGGVLFLTTPDLGHPRRPEPLLAWGSVRPPEHVHLFTKSGMISLLEAQGFPAARALPHAKPGMRVIARRPKDNPAV